MVAYINGTCGACGEFTFVNEDQTECISETCVEGEILLEDGTCLECDEYTHPDTDARTCIVDTCNNSTEYLTKEGICDVCDDFTYSDPSTFFKSCASDDCVFDTQIQLIDGTC